VNDAPAPSSPFLDRLDACLRVCVPQYPVELSGDWATSLRRADPRAAQSGSGLGRVADIVDVVWRGSLSAASPISGLAFVVVADGVYWSKSPEISPLLPVNVALHAYADRKPDLATFDASIAGSMLPGVPVPAADDLAQMCTLASGPLITGRVLQLARVNAAALYALLIPREMLKMGRKRLWRLRDNVAFGMPEDLRQLLTRRRAGFVPGDAR